VAVVTGVERARFEEIWRRERERFADSHPRSHALWDRARRSLIGGVPMTWMLEWAGQFPLFMESASGARVACVDGHEYVDLCLGDTGAMTGHAPSEVVDAVRRQLERGITTMLPTEDAVWVGEELARRFGRDRWQFTLTATDANRFAIRIAREITERPKVLVFNHCYHGTVDETFIRLRPDGGTGPTEGSVGPPVDPSVTTKVVEFNEVEALEAALAAEDVACVLTEPALTNIGIVLPEPGFHDALRELTRRTGTLLIIDETHTISAGPGGYTREHGLRPDVVTVGKPIGSGIPAGAFGMSDELVDRMFARADADYQDVGGIGGTLAGNALSVAAMRATLEHVLTDQAYARMIPLAERFAGGVQQTIDRHGAPWHITRLGCRAEYLFQPDPPRTGAQAAARRDHELDAVMHLYSLNRGILMTPFHNMALMSPATAAADVDRHTEVFAAAADELLG
jgi:glutamate-1-semialdehyde 2,1-aminomutase